jgi:hypothetical protein
VANIFSCTGKIQLYRDTQAVAKGAFIVTYPPRLTCRLPVKPFPPFVLVAVLNDVSGVDEA